MEEKFSLLKVQSTIDAAQDVVQVLAKKKAQRPKEQCIMIKKSVVLQNLINLQQGLDQLLTRVIRGRRKLKNLQLFQLSIQNLILNGQSSCVMMTLMFILSSWLSLEKRERCLMVLIGLKSFKKQMLIIKGINL